MMMMITQVHSSPSSLLSSLTYSSRRVIRVSRDHHLHAETLKNHYLSSGSSSSTSLCSCGRKHFLEAASPTRCPFFPSLLLMLRVPRLWLFNGLFSKAKFCTPNDYVTLIYLTCGENVIDQDLSALGCNENICVFGMDPNQKMEKFACESAREAGMKPENFRFMQGVGEAIPLDDDSVDAVVATLVLCSVSDVTQTLNEIKWVLKPGGIFLFIEHVAAKDGSFLRNVQNVLDPVQQVVADGCHLTRNTDLYISAAGFDGGTEINNAAIYSFPWVIRPHVYGVAYK